jgi:S1-C subfamily serine protease
MDTMKRQFLAVAAAGLIALGVIGDRIISAATAQPAAAPVAAASNSSPTNVTTVNAAPSSSSATVDAATVDAATQHAYAVAGPSVVYVVSQGVGSGSGVIYDSKGDIVTNDHVVSGASGLTVTLQNGKTYTATLVGTDAADDLAVIHINAPNLTPAQFASGSSYQVAQTVLAIGNPLGLKGSVTSGLISGLGRVEQEPNGAYIPNAIQTSAPINPGNSGGALVNLEGVVVGIPTLEQTSTGEGTAAQNVGFAIPSDRVVSIANQIIATGKVQHTGRAYLGIEPTDAASQGGSFFNGGYFGGGQGSGGSTTSGALVQQVASSGPAASAGLQQGDIITAADGTQVTDAQDLLTVLATKKPGDTISLKIDRNGSTQTIQVHLGELPASG